MRADRRAFALAAALAWTGGAAALKAGRYSEAPAPRQERTEAAADAFLRSRGLVAEGTRPVTSDGHYVVHVYGRPGCADRMAYAVVSHGNESLEALRRTLGADLAYLETGHLAAAPQQRAAAFHALLASGLQRIGGPVDDVPAIIAISPAPGRGCAGPDPGEWAGFSALPDNYVDKNVRAR